MTTPSLFDEGQPNIPGLESAGTKIKGKPPLIRSDSPSQLPLMASVRELPEWSLAPQVPGQLSFNGSQQLELSEAPAQPVQLGLLPDPPPWELADEPSVVEKAPGRLARRRRRSKISPGQTTLF